MPPKPSDKSPPPANTRAESIPALILRYGIFSVLVFGMILGIWALAPSAGALLFSEGSALEWFQLGLLLAAAGVFLFASPFPQLSRLLAILATAAAIRELDAAFDRLLPGGGWQLPFAILILLGLYLGWKSKNVLLEQVRQLAGCRGFALMWAGLMVAVPFAQMVGHGEFLDHIFGDDHPREYKRLIEECAESLGYLLIFCASIDWALHPAKAKAR